MSVTRRNHGTGHSYAVDGVKRPGVTAILRETMPKPGLIQWAADCSAAAFCNNWTAVRRMPMIDRYEWARKAHTRDRDEGAHRGTTVHLLASAINMGADAAVPEELRGHVEAYRDFMARTGLATVAVELVIANRAVGYCGTLDLIGDLAPLMWDGEKIPAARWLLEVKTSRSGIYAESALQCCAYEHGEVFAGPNGEELKVASLGIERCGAVHVRADGWDLRPLQTGPAVWAHFQRLALDYADIEAMKTEWVGAAIDPPAA